jgi:squalene synthase HpnC
VSLVPATIPAAGGSELPLYPQRRQDQARAQENFPIAAWLLRPSRRQARASIYGFCRLVDDIGDEQLGDARAQLERCQEELEACYSGQPRHPIFVRLQTVIQRSALPPGPFHRLIQANLQDQELLRYDNWQQLDQYCDLSANPVGELVLALEGITDQKRVELSNSVCTGLQLANMWQDVASDRQRGRRYLPLELLHQHGATESEWEAGLATAGMRAAMAHAVGKARQLLCQGWPLVQAVPGLMRMEMATFILSGLAATDGVLAAGDRVFAEKAALPKGARRRVLAQAAWSWRSSSPPGEL